MARDDPPQRRVEARPIERVRHFADQPADRVARQPGVGIERDDVTDLLRHLWRLAIQVEEVGGGRAPQQRVQFAQFAALAFPADQTVFVVVPDPLTVQQYDPVPARAWAMKTVEPGDAGNRHVQYRRTAAYLF